MGKLTPEHDQIEKKCIMGPGIDIRLERSQYDFK